MVKHHKKKNKKSKPVEVPEPSKEQLLKDLDRFAGSSEEEDNDDINDVKNDIEIRENQDTDDESISGVDDDDNDEGDGDILDGEEADEEHDGDAEDEDEADSSDDDEYGQSAVQQARMNQLIKKSIKKSNDDSDDDVDESEEDEEILQDGMIPTGQAGMAGAMAKILGFSAPPKSKKQSKAIVLSKTITPLQKQQKKEDAAADALKQKRKQRREINLTAMHIPLSAATSRPIVGKGDDASDLIALAMKEEIEQESMHRRVATRGVVALFNTIAKHQQQRAQQQAETSITTKRNDEVKSMSKHGFLDLLKNTGSASEKGKDKKDEQLSKVEKSSASKKDSKGWNALKDDFMMNNKLKDWDKALSSDEDSEENDDDSTRGNKRGLDADDVMDDDDWSSDDGGVSNAKRRKR